MCSICGIIDFKNKQNINEDIVKKMGAMLGHRGPDQNGVFVGEYAALQHNRLAIMDIENGLQPMTRTFEGKTYTLVYNGEIYNTPELRKELESYGVNFETRCDTEVVLYAYIIFKEACAEKLNGIFAFAVYDEEAEKVYIARDRFGIKPLFYTQIGSTLLFASEVKALLKHPEVKPVVDKQGIWQLLFLSPVKLIGTSVFKNIHEVCPACHGTYDQRGLSLTKYWKLEAKEFTGTEQDAVEQTKYILTDAIEKQLVSDAPLATFLSGGLDSSIISSVAAKYYKEHGEVLGTYSFEFEGNKENFHNTLFQPDPDDEYAVYLANYLGTNHRILTAGTQDVARLLIDATKFRDMPGQADIDSSLLYFCSKVKENHTVAISGECADEIFGGYPWFYREEMLSKPFFPWIHDPFKRVNLFDDSIVKSQEGYEHICEIYKQSMSECPLLDSDSDTMRRSRLATWLSTNYFMTSLLERKDRMSMASGVEVRVPFADHRVLEYVYNVPWEIKFKGNVEKALLRNAMAEYLPDKILNRKKSPYPKTHNPQYEKAVIAALQERMASPTSVLKELINQSALEDLIQSPNATWFGQLMSKPQLIAWLIQLDYWFEAYHVVLE